MEAVLIKQDTFRKDEEINIESHTKFSKSFQSNLKMKYKVSKNSPGNRLVTIRINIF